MTALATQPHFISPEKYLADEEMRDTKHEYKGGIVYPMTDFSNFVELKSPQVLVHRRMSDGTFAIEPYETLESTIPLPEIEATLPLAELYDRVTFAD